ncbi:MAG: sulfite exporter TauE/SafE family protein [Bdellovibrionota bacterium]
MSPILSISQAKVASVGVFFIIAGISCFATLLSSMSGAGASIIIVPAWILMGYSFPVAVAASTINGALRTPLAARNYLHGRQIDWPLVGGLVGCGLVGAFFGERLVVSTDSVLLQRVIGVLILVLVALAFRQKKFGLAPLEGCVNRSITSCLAFPFGCYEAIFGSGNGLFTSAMLVKTRGALLGAQAGSHIGRKKGAGFVKFVFLVLGGLLGAKLALGF